MKAAAESNLKKVSLELGGKSPSVVLPDANVTEAAKWATFGIMCVVQARANVNNPLTSRQLFGMVGLTWARCAALARASTCTNPSMMHS
jgi:acyl-CoA reductase-like NAD-dependent aldehyde dehydrogenase